MNKNPIDIASNTFSFLNGLTKYDLKEASIKEKISVISWARKVVGKHQHLDTIHAKIDIMNHQVQLFIDLFTSLLKNGLPFFWEEKGRMFSQTEYHV